MSRVVVNKNDISKSAGSDLQITAPASWTLSSIAGWPEQLQANRDTPANETPNDAAAADQQKFRVTIGLKDLPATGVQQGVLTLNFTSPDGPRILTVPLSFIWL